MSFSSQLGAKVLIAKKLFKKTVQKKIPKSSGIPGLEGQAVQDGASQAAHSHAHGHAHGHAHSHSPAAATTGGGALAQGAKRPGLMAQIGFVFFVTFVGYKLVEIYNNKCNVLVQQYGMEAIQYDDDLQALETCTKAYKKNLGPFFHRQRMFKEYVANLVQEKTLSAEMILGFQIVCNLFGFKEKKLAQLCMNTAGEKFPHEQNQLSLLYIVMDRTFKSQDALEVIRPLKFKLAAEYGEGNEALIQLQSFITTLTESAYVEKVASLGDAVLEVEKPGDWEPLGLSEEDADNIFNSAYNKKVALMMAEVEQEIAAQQQAEMESRMDAIRWQDYYNVSDSNKRQEMKTEPFIQEYEEEVMPVINLEMEQYNATRTDLGEAKEKKSAPRRSLEERHSSESSLEEVTLLDEEVDRYVQIFGEGEEADEVVAATVATSTPEVTKAPAAAAESSPNTYECGDCGYMLFVAQGRDEKFFGEGYSCPNCGAAKEQFTKVDRSPVNANA